MNCRKFVIVVLLILTQCIDPIGNLETAAGHQDQLDSAIHQRYAISAEFDPVQSIIHGAIEVEWTNLTGENQGGLPFRLYPNADHYGDASIEVTDVVVHGEPGELAVDEAVPTVGLLPFPEPVAPEVSVTVEMRFTTIVPQDSSGSYGIFRGNSESGLWSLVNWYPIVAGWEPGVGWYLEPPAGMVDPTFVTASAWHLELRHPAPLTVVAGGQESTVIDGDQATTTVELEPARELAVMLLPAESVVVQEAVAGDVPVTITLTIDDAIPGMHEALLDMAQESVGRYGAWFGEPLDGELDLVSTSLDGALGVSWTGSIWVELSSITADGSLDTLERESLRFVMLHEIAHQWLSSMVGSNSNAHTWLTEGLASAMAVAVLRDADGPEAAERAMAGLVAGGYRAFVNGGQDAVTDSPIGALDPVVHSIVTYGKAAVGFEAIRQAIGDEAFHASLQALVDEFAWGIAAPEDVRAIFEASAGGKIGNLWSFWFLEAQTTLHHVDQVIANAGQ